MAEVTIFTSQPLLCPLHQGIKLVNSQKISKTNFFPQSFFNKLRYLQNISIVVYDCQ
ncbi:hypothetical protein AVDCRST_MAG84-1160 [uncultured Microcoleus sp.]|uniref:Uncharacterized protein n=1 Tax=uncultured Microcoleus sp. TaxID=259945 RepID=A0A6J4KWT6_9CYAN|nr:hypothetical protein AVDCRST_MAG84-1160 [uncultured Microcoleus sp.]